MAVVQFVSTDRLQPNVAAAAAEPQRGHSCVLHIIIIIIKRYSEKSLKPNKKRTYEIKRLLLFWAFA